MEALFWERLESHKDQCLCDELEASPLKPSNELLPVLLHTVICWIRKEEFHSEESDTLWGDSHSEDGPESCKKNKESSGFHFRCQKIKKLNLKWCTRIKQAQTARVKDVVIPPDILVMSDGAVVSYQTIPLLQAFPNCWKLGAQDNMRFLRYEASELPTVLPEQ